MWTTTVVLLGCVVMSIGYVEELAQKMSEASECIQRLLDCSPMYVSIAGHEINGSLFYDPKDLERSCRLNEPYLQCIENIKLFCMSQGYNEIEVTMIKNRLWIRELCAANSKWKKMYAKHASCIRRESLRSSKKCTALTFDPQFAGRENLCRYLEGFVDCTAKVLKRECGVQASELYLRISFMKGNREYLCYEKEEGPKKQESFTMRIAKQMLSNVQSLMKNISTIVKATMSENDAAYVLQELDPIEVERIRNLWRRKPPTNSHEDDVSPTTGAPLYETELEYKTAKEIKEKSFMKDWNKSKSRFSQVVANENLESLVKNTDELLEADWFHPVDETKVQSKDIDSDKVSLLEHGTDDDYSCKILGERLKKFHATSDFESNASFNVYEIQDHGEKTHLGSGQTMVQWETMSNAPLDDLFCSWLDPDSSTTLFKCAVKLTELQPARQDHQKRPLTHPILLALYTSPANADYSKQVALSEVATICVENYLPSKEVLAGRGTLLPLHSKSQEYMDFHRKSEEEREMGTPEVDVESSENNCELDNSCSLSDDELYSIGTLRKRSLELLQAEHDMSDAFDKNLSFVYQKDYELPENIKYVEDKFDSLLEQKLSDPFKKYQTSHCQTADEVTQEKEDSSEHPIVGDNVSSFAESVCLSKVEVIDVPEIDTDCKNGNIQNLVGTTIKPGVYVEVTSLATIAPLNLKFRKGCRFAENVNYIVVGNPYHPTESPLEVTESIYFDSSSAEARPMSMSLLDAELFLKDGIDSIQAEQIAESIQE